MGYDRQVGYLTYYRQGERQGNCGFLKLEQSGEDWCVRIQVQKLPIRQTIRARVLFLAEGLEQEQGTITLENGQGVFTRSGRADRAPGPDGVRIYLGGEQELCWGDCGRKTEKIPLSMSDQPAQEKTESPEQQENPAGELEVQEKTARVYRPMDQEGEEEKPEDHRQEKEEGGVRLPAAEQCQWEKLQEEGEEPQEGKQRGEREKEHGNASPYGRRLEGGLQEEKWLQLEKIYPHLQPFGDERDYLAIGPSDFVVMTEESFRRANNSFLLHGYYHYGHLVLCRISGKGETVYMLGVPGLYTEGEKQAAILYGFESFESNREPAAEGDFGYYLLRVRL